MAGLQEETGCVRGSAAVGVSAKDPPSPSAKPGFQPPMLSRSAGVA